MTGRSLFEAENLAFSYPGLDLLNDLSFAIKPGLTLLRGGSGRGKKTLLRLISGELQASSGLVMRRAKTQWCEDPADPGSDDIVASAWLAARRPRFSQWQVDLEADLIEGFGLSPHIDKPLYMLSTGSRRKVGLLGAAASGAELTLIDHIFVTHSHLDHVSSIAFFVDSVGALRPNPVTVYALPQTIASLKKNLFNWDIWPDFTVIPTPEQPWLRYQAVEVGESIVLNGRKVTVLPAVHTVPAVGYAIP